MLTAEGAKKLAYREPWLYHVVWKSDASARETIASDGLTPGSPRHRWHPLFAPRPGHVYLATHQYMTKVAWWLRSEGDDVYAVATNALLPTRVNPDEDHFSGDGVEACDGLGLQRPMGNDLWDSFGASVVPSFGEWADAIDLGSDPKHTAHSVCRGSLAYRGIIPPKALLRWDETSRRWFDGSDANGEQAL